MFILKFIAYPSENQNEKTAVFSVSHFETVRTVGPRGPMACEVIFPDPQNPLASMTLRISEEWQDWDACFVENESGSTIDTYRVASG